MVKTEFMPKATCDIFEKINEAGGLPGAILIGGTAMAIQCGHRLSEDLDFWLPHNPISQSGVDALIRRLSDRCEIKLITPQSDIVRARINGFNLLDSVRDYAIDGVKVTFFHRNDDTHKAFASLGTIKSKNIEIMSSDSIFYMKSYVITQRSKSRDIFDLKYFLEHGKSLIDIFDAIRKFSPGQFAEESIKATLSGIIPVDKSDEGISSVSSADTIDDIYAFFTQKINEYEMLRFSEIERESSSNRNVAPLKPKM